MITTLAETYLILMVIGVVLFFGFFCVILGWWTPLVLLIWGGVWAIINMPSVQWGKYNNYYKKSIF
jgi:hypothetical protein